MSYPANYPARDPARDPAQRDGIDVQAIGVRGRQVNCSQVLAVVLAVAEAEAI